MKKIRGILILMLTLAALAVTAYAAAPTQSGVYGATAETGYTLTVKDAAGTAIAAQPATVGDKDQNFYPEAVRFTLTTPPNLTGQQLVLALEGDATLPTEKNIRYIDQKAASGTVTFDIYPSELKAGKYSICLVGTDEKLKPVAEFTYYQAYLIGDADGNGKVNVNDAVAILKHIVGNSILTGNTLLAADADANGSVNVNDAVAVLKYIVGNGTLGKQ